MGRWRNVVVEVSAGDTKVWEIQVTRYFGVDLGRKNHELDIGLVRRFEGHLDEISFNGNK